MFSDKEIIDHALGYGLIEPFDVEQVQPASYDLELGVGFKVLVENKPGEIDLLQPARYSDHPARKDFLVAPRKIVLGTTMEYVRIPANVIGRLEGKSTVARQGLLVHVTGGFIDPGFNGNITLEFANLTDMPIHVWSGMKIAQISFAKMERDAERPYGHIGLGSKYQFQEGTTGARRSM